MAKEILIFMTKASILIQRHHSVHQCSLKEVELKVLKIQKQVAGIFMNLLKFAAFQYIQNLLGVTMKY